MKKKLFFLLCMALTWTVSLTAQNISVVTANGATTLVRTLDEAIAIVNENPGCVVYLPGGGHSVSDDSKITKKVTIIGIGHRMKGENADGFTTISGNIWFNEGSNGSAILGCYLTGDVNIGYDGKEVNDVLVRYCNMDELIVHNKQCKGTVVNQCYIRTGSMFNAADCEFTHNIAAFCKGLDRGTIEYNVFTSTYYYNGSYAICNCDDCSINHNVVIKTSPHSGSNCQVTGNMSNGTWGEDPISMVNIDWNDVFVKPAGANSTSDYHFKEEYKQYESQVGVYVGNQFNDTGLPPVPYIVAKQISMETDASGKLNIKIRVNAGQ